MKLRQYYGLTVDRTCRGLGWVPGDHPNVKIEVISLGEFYNV